MMNDGKDIYTDTSVANSLIRNSVTVSASDGQAYTVVARSGEELLNLLQGHAFGLRHGIIEAQQPRQ